MEAFIHTILSWLTSLGYWGILLGLMIEIIPSEIVLAYAGFMVANGDISMLGAVIYGTIGGTVAQWFIYWIGRYGGRPFLEKYGKYLLIHEKHLNIAEAWFQRYGTGMIFTARFIPVVRHAISIPAGIAKMSSPRFVLYTTMAIIPWSIFFIYLGMQLKDNWTQINQVAVPYITPFIWLSIGLTSLYLIYKIIYKGKTEK